MSSLALVGALPLGDISVGVLAAIIGPKEVISLLFVIVAFLSWLFSVINGQKAPGGGARPNPPPGGRRPEKDLQAEINRFLKNAMGQNKDVDELEVLEDDEPPRPKPKPKRVPNAAAAQRPPAKRPPEAESSAQGPRPGGRIAQRKGPGSTGLGSGVREHLAEHMQDRVTKQAQQHLAHGVAEKVEHDLGKFSVNDQRSSAAAVVTERQPSITASAVAEIVRDPATLKQAFVMNLVLTRPAFGRGKRAYSSRGSR